MKSDSKTTPQPADQALKQFTAYQLPGTPPMEIVPADPRRLWIDATRDHFANRCLPLVMANQLGWFLLNTSTIEVTWGGSDEPESLTVRPTEAGTGTYAGSQFGYGILTFAIPYLFRTAPGYNLMIKGPANRPKDGIDALEGVVESDWICSTFTMNWKFTRRNHTVRFVKGEPIANVIPQRRNELVEFDPEIVPITDNPEIWEEFQHWHESRQRYNSTLGDAQPMEIKRSQGDYIKGKTTLGKKAPEHQVKLNLPAFRKSGED